jgi:hypothetical protein
MARAGIVGTATQLHPLAFVDRLGHAHIPTAGAEVLARAFAAAEPGSVTMHLEAVEREMHAKGYEPGDRFWHDYLREQRPGFALARSWSGFDRELEELQREIGRLRELVLRAVTELERAGAEQSAWRLKRALDGR